MDIDMPIMTGTEATAEINRLVASGTVSPTPIIAHTAGHFAETVNFFENQGFAGFCPKPTILEDFIKVLRTYKVIP